MTGVNCEESLLEYQEIESTEVSIDKLGKKESVESKNCNVYVVHTWSENLQSYHKEKSDTEKSADVKYVV